MIDWRDRDGSPYRSDYLASALRWTAAAAVVVAAHGSAIWIAMNWETAQAALGDPPAAIMIELAPLAVAPEAPVQNLAPGPEMTEAEPDPTPAPEPDIKLPELPQQEKEEAVVARPPLPEEQKPTPKPEPAKKPIDRKKPKAPRTTAPTPSAVPPSERATAPALGAASTSSMSQASWRSELMAHLNRHKRFPPGAAGSGTVSVVFTIGRSGQVLSARLSRSSGDSILDREAVALVQRASPVPAPPAEMVDGGSVALSVPVRFNR